MFRGSGAACEVTEQALKAATTTQASLAFNFGLKHSELRISNDGFKDLPAFNVVGPALEEAQVVRRIAGQSIKSPPLEGKPGFAKKQCHVPPIQSAKGLGEGLCHSCNLGCRNSLASEHGGVGCGSRDLPQNHPQDIGHSVDNSVFRTRILWSTATSVTKAMSQLSQQTLASGKWTCCYHVVTLSCFILFPPSNQRTFRGFVNIRDCVSACHDAKDFMYVSCSSLRTGSVSFLAEFFARTINCTATY